MTTDELRALLLECKANLLHDMTGGHTWVMCKACALDKKIDIALASDFAVVPREPTEGLLVSMALRLNHGFGLDSEQSRKSQVTSMRQVYEEISGAGFYKVEREIDYKAMITAAEGK